MATQSKAWVCDRSLARIAGLNPVGGMDVYCEWCVLYTYRFVRRTDHSSRGVLPSVSYFQNFQTGSGARPPPCKVGPVVKQTGREASD